MLRSVSRRRTGGVTRQVYDVVIGIDRATDGQLDAAAALHAEQLRGGFMTSLGPRFLREVIANIVRSRHGVALFAVEVATGDVLGFVLGTTNAFGLYWDFLRRHAVRAVFAAFPRILSLSTMKRIFETLFYPSKRVDDGLPEGELLDLAVADRMKGKGLAQQLFAAFTGEMAKRGHRSFRITTGESLTRAHRFYEQLGAVFIRKMEIHRRSATRIYVYTPQATL